MIILDNYCAEGSNLDDYNTEAQRADKATKIVPISFADLTVLSIFRLDRKNNAFLCNMLAPGEYGISSKNGMFETQAASIAIEENMPDELVEEAIDKETLFLYDGSLYFLGDTIYKTLASVQTGIGGKFLKSPGFERNLALVRQAEIDPIVVNAVVRQEGKYKKIVSVFKSRFKRIPFTALYETAHETGLSCYFWRITQKKAEVYLDFPEKYGDLIPGIYLEVSDTGTVSAGVSAVWRCGSSWYVQEKVKLDEDTLNSFMSTVSKLHVKQAEFGTKYCEVLNNSNKDVLFSKIADRYKIGSMLGNKGREAVVAQLKTKNCNLAQSIHELIRLPETGCPGVKFTNNQQTLYRTLLNEIVTNGDKSWY